MSYQLGAVATHPLQRGPAHLHEPLLQVLAPVDTHAAPVLRFADAKVVDFYPRFGFHAPA